MHPTELGKDLTDSTAAVPPVRINRSNTLPARHGGGDDGGDGGDDVTGGTSGGTGRAPGVGTDGAGDTYTSMRLGSREILETST